MKKLFVSLVMSMFMATTAVNANTVNLNNLTVSTIVQEDEQADVSAEASFTQELKTRFIEGGPGFMGIVLICLILGLAIAIERIIFLNLATTNTKKLTDGVEEALANGGVDAWCLWRIAMGIVNQLLFSTSISSI